MKMKLQFPAKGINNSGLATLETRPMNTGLFTLETVTSLGEQNKVVLDLQEANELREWLNKNLPR